MKITYGKFYKQSEKNLKRHHKEKAILIMIVSHIKMCFGFSELKNNPISKMYGYERLKHELSPYYSFNLCKKGGQIRLVFSINESLNQVCLEYISIKHYEDFKNILKRV